VSISGHLAKSPGRHSLSTDELAALWRRYKLSHDPLARERLVLTYAPLCKYVAGRMGSTLPSYIDVEDLTSYGLVGLLDAIDRFEPSRGVKFETFALARIRGAIIDELRSLDWAPRALRQNQRRLIQVAAEIEQREGRPATDAELAKRMGLTESELNQLLADIAGSSMVALEELFAPSPNDDEALALGDAVEDETSPQPGPATEHAILRDLLADAIVRLPERERIVVSLYHYDGLSLREIGQVLGVTESRASQLRTKAIVRLRGALLAAGLAPESITADP
jgi:RNA polymerase sigma factor for flagellar operon FliA